jgi:hypothetical protein
MRNDRKARAAHSGTSIMMFLFNPAKDYVFKNVPPALLLPRGAKWLESWIELLFERGFGSENVIVIRLQPDEVRIVFYVCVFLLMPCFV